MEINASPATALRLIARLHGRGQHGTASRYAYELRETHPSGLADLILDLLAELEA